MPSGKFYTTKDIAVIKSEFPKHGAKVCAEILGRSVRAIRTFAHKQGIRRDEESLKNDWRLKMAEINAAKYQSGYYV